MSYEIKYSPESLGDLKNIISYTQEKWGQKQTDKYISQIHEKITSLANQEFLAVRSLENDINYLPFKDHYNIFFEIKYNQIRVTRILHQATDWKMK